MLECVRETAPELRILFNTTVTAVNLASGEVEFAGDSREKFDLIVGADGAGSLVRSAIQEQREDMKVSKFSIN